MHPQCCVDSDVADWLSIIHLERYRDTFEQNGYGSVRDVISLGKEDLLKLGITATGHRKRILNLVQQTQMLVGDKSGQMAGDAHYRSGKHADSLDGPKTEEWNDVAAKKEDFTETVSDLEVDHDAVDHRQHPPLSKEPTPLVAKPVPKPRTVFSLAHRAANPEQVPLLAPQTPVPAFKPTSFSEQPLGTFIILEGFDPGESTTDAEKLEHQARPGVPGIILPPQSRPRESHSESALQSFVPVNDMSAEVKSVGESSCSSIPICLTSEDQPANTSSAVPIQTATKLQRQPLWLPSAASQSASPETRKEMASGAIAVLLPMPAHSMERKETLRSEPSPQPSGLPMQNGTVTMKNANSLGQLCLDLHHVPQESASRSGPVEESISPYCESMFGHDWSTQEQGEESLEGQEYEEVPEYSPSQREEGAVIRSARVEEKSQGANRETVLSSSIAQNEAEGYSTVEAAGAKGSPFRLSDYLYPDETLEDLTISPYASYTSLSERPPAVLNGWLDKLSPQGNYVFQRRFVRFDGKKLMYFNNEKEPYSKGVVPLPVIDMVRSTKDNKFQVITKHRIFVFRAESEAQRIEWCSTLQQKVSEQRLLCPQPCLSSSSSRTHFQKFGYLELKGYKSKLFVVLILAEMWLYKSEQFFKMGIAICLIEMHGATIREAKGRNFELITPFKIFSFGAESEREKREWMEALQNSIAETLYDYEVAEKIWSNKANRFCADCHAPSPDWASINLCVVICKQCAGQHRSLGSSISKVQSLKLDTSIWSNEMVQLFIMLGNEQVNKFWAAHLPPSEALYPHASAEQRRDFIAYKYRYGRYRMPHPQYSSQEKVLQALCAAVSGPGLLKTMFKFFATTLESDMTDCSVTLKAKPWCNTWQGQRVSCSGNLSGEALSSEGVYNEITQPLAHCGYLYKAPAMAKLIVPKKSREEFQRVWCSLEKSFLFYETDRSSEPVGKIEMADVISLGVNRTETLASPGSSDRFRQSLGEATHRIVGCFPRPYTCRSCDQDYPNCPRTFRFVLEIAAERVHFTLELYLGSERIQQLEADGPDTLQSWASAIGKWFTPVSCHCLLGYEFQRVGRLCYKSMLNPNQWLQGFFVLQKSHLFICPREEGAAEDSINLRQLQELSIVPLAEGPEKKEMLILVEMGR